ncbi:hypothetical protein ACFS07_12690 [Undibacterium arcticum]
MNQKNESWRLWHRHCQAVFQFHWVEPETGEVVREQIKQTRFLEHCSL